MVLRPLSRSINRNYSTNANLTIRTHLPHRRTLAWSLSDTLPSPAAEVKRH